MLFERGCYFLEMGEALTYKYNRKELVENLNLRICVGFSIFQFVELTLKAICEHIGVEYPQTHNLVPIISTLTKGLTYRTDFPLEAMYDLKFIFRELQSCAKLYGELSYGARYVANIKFSNAQMDQLFSQAYRLRDWYKRWI